MDISFADTLLARRDNLTAAQQINFERAKKGLPPTSEFTFQEAESVLKENMPKLFDSLVDARIPVIEAATRVESIDADFAEVPARRRIRATADRPRPPSTWC